MHRVHAINFVSCSGPRPKRLHECHAREPRHGAARHHPPSDDDRGAPKHVQRSQRFRRFRRGADPRGDGRCGAAAAVAAAAAEERRDGAERRRSVGGGGVGGELGAGENGCGIAVGYIGWFGGGRGVGALVIS